MKFAKLKKGYILGYGILETNDNIMSLIAKFLAYDVSNNSEKYLDWLNKIHLTVDWTGIAGNHTNLEIKGNTIKIAPAWENISDGEELTPEDLMIKFEPTKEQLIDIIKKWNQLIKNDPIPENIVVQNENGQINIEAVANDDKRFSRIIKNDKNAFAKIEASSIFNNYFKVESNNENYFSLGLLFTDYLIWRENILDWLKNNSNNDFYIISSNYAKFYKQNNSICANVGYPTTKKSNFCFPISPIELSDLFHQWNKILKSIKFPLKILIYELNNKVMLEQIANE